jgi:ATP-binding cassette subfamily B protein
MAVVILCGTLFEAAFDPVIRYSFKFLIDKAIVPRDYSYLVLILSILGAVVIVYAFLCILGDLLWARFGTSVINDIRQNLFVHTMALSEDFFRRRPSGDILNCFLADAGTIEHSLVTVVPYALLGAGSIVVSVGMLFSLHWPLAIMNIAGLAVCFALPRFFMKGAVQRGFALRQQEGRIAGRLQENLTSHSIIRVFSLEGKVSQDLSEELKKLLHLAVRANFLSYFVQRLPNVFFLILAFIILGFGMVLAYNGTITMGTLVSYQILSLGLSASIANITWITPNVVEALAGFQRINTILNERQGIIDAPGAKELPLLQRGLGFQKVSFSYEKDRPALEEISFHIPKNSFAVLVGPSGSGKTSILNLICRLYDPDSGAVLIDETDIRSVRQISLRRQIGLVPQAVTLFETTIKENIRLGNLRANDEEIAEAARKAEIHDFIASLPLGYDTPIGEGGEGLSEGQKQRVALARVLVRKPAVVILDEATSALDPITESGVFDTLSRLSKESTIIAVTHRLNLALRAEVIFVVEEGRIVASGSHEMLIQQSDLYAKLWLDNKDETKTTSCKSG